MARFGRFFRCFVQSAADKGLRGLAELVPGAGYLYDVVADAIQRMGDHGRDAQMAELRAEIEAVAQPAPAESVREEAARAVREAAPQLPPEQQEQLALYLSLVPDAVRASLKRTDDPGGTTVPAALALDRPEAVVRLLPPRLPRFKPGDALAGMPGWVLDRHLGLGGFGEVWLARHQRLTNLRGAAKFGLDLTSQDWQLLHEADVIDRVMGHGRHPHVVPLTNANLTADPPWLMFEYVDGGDLTGLIHAWKSLPGPDRYARSLTAMRQLADAVGHFHALPDDRPIVHRDLKPANVLVRHLPGGGFTLLVADFGIGVVAARRALRDGQVATISAATMPTALRGAYTPLYASKQQRQFAPADVRDDVYALGVIWYQALVGDTTSDRPSGKWRKRLAEWGVPDAAMDLLEACCDDDPDERPKDAAELGRLLAGMPPAVAATPHPCPPPQGEPRPGKEASASSLSEVARGTKELELPKEFVNSVGMKFVWIKPGRFLMGSPAGEEGRLSNEAQHGVTLTHGFYMGVHPVTQEQWQRVMGTNPSHIKGQANLPVEQVSWDDCQEFCRKLSQLDVWRYTLPTEAEWEYACRAGTTTPFHFGVTISTDQANYDCRQTYGPGRKGDYREKTTPVGSFPANAWGLHDMHGNVWEWCQDAYGPYPAGETADQLLDQLSDNCRVLRGGSWGNPPVYCRAACRHWYDASLRSGDVGLRVVSRLD